MTISGGVSRSAGGRRRVLPQRKEGKPTKGDVLGRPAGHVVEIKDRKPIVTEWAGMEDFFHAPPSYEVFAAQYYGYIRNFISGYASYPEDIEEITQNIITRFIERDSIGVFSNDWESLSETGKSGFRSYLSRFLAVYAPGQNRNMVRYRKHYTVLYDAPANEERGTTWGDENTQPTELPSHLVEFTEIVEELRAKAGPDRRAVVDIVVSQAMSTSIVRIAELAREMGIAEGRKVSQREAKQRLEEIRGMLRSIVAG